jgi:hypothetical protein
MIHTHLLAGLFVFALAISAWPLRAQDAQPTVKPPSAEAQRKLGSPGPEHERLATYTGAWDVEIRMGAGGAAMVYRGQADHRMLAGRRFLQMDYQAKDKADNIDGSFIIGFDSRHKRFTLVALDSFGPYFVTSQGKAGDNAVKIRMLGTDDDPMMKAMGFTKEFVHVLELRSADEFAIEVWFVDTRNAARREFKYMDYVFKRKK